MTEMKRIDLAKKAEEIAPWIVEQRRYFHENPELSFQEVNTTKHIIAELEKLDIPVVSFPDYHGCIGLIQGGKPGKTMVLRGDIDALPIQEQSGLSFASKNPGVMHACGHDCHTSMLLGAAKLLGEVREEICGNVKLLFQSGEEAFTGSHYYVDKGYLADASAAVGVHVWPTAPSGKVVVKDGELMASCDNFKIVITGKESEGHLPQEGKDAILCASGMILALQTVVSRAADPDKNLVVSVGTIRAGKSYDKVAGEAVLEGTVRCFNPVIRQKAKEAILQIVEESAKLYGCHSEISYIPLESAIINQSRSLNESARASLRKMYGEDVLGVSERASSSEDFSYIMEHIPDSLFLFLGCYDAENDCIYPPHNEKFKVKEDILPVGSAAYAQIAIDYLEKLAKEDMA